MSEMLLRVARAIYGSDAFIGDPDEAMTLARAAVQALLEPDEAMVEQMPEAWRQLAPNIYTAMLSTIMDEGEK